VPFTHVRYEKVDGVATITKDGPGDSDTARFGMAAATIEQIADALEDAARDPEVVVVVLTTAGDAVHQGAAVAGELFPDGALDAVDFFEVIGAGQRLGQLTETLEKPVIGVAKGGALGGGLEHLLACDFVVAAEDAAFTLPEVRFGLAVGWGAAWRVPRAIGWMPAKELLLLGESIDGRRAAELGLVTTAVPADEVDAAVADLIARLRQCSPTSIAFTKLAMARSWSAVGSGDWDPSVLGAMSGDFAEAVTAMREQRAPRFRPVRRLLRRLS